jgi:hypothetical protein
MAGGRISDIQKMTEDGVDLVFNRAAKMPRKKYYEAIVSTKVQRKKIGNYHTMGDMGPAEQKEEGDVILFDKIAENYQTTIESQTVTKGVEASLEQLTYDLENVVQNRFGTGLLRVMQSRKERHIAELYNDSFTNTGADGVAIIAATHPLQRSASVNNNLVSGALSPETLVDAKNRFNAIYDQAGDFFDTEPTHLLIHPNKLYLALQILQSQLMALQLSNTKNTVNDVMPIKIVVNKYLDYNNSTGVSPWFLIDKTMSDAGCVLQVKRGVGLKTWWENNNEVFRGRALEMYAGGFISPGYGIVGSAG